MSSQRIERNWLARIAAIGAATLGVLMLAGGLALGLALISSRQPPLQVVTAVVLTTVGLVNLRYSRQIWRADRRALLLSAVATSTLMGYLGVGLRDFGEPLWAHAVYLVVLLGLWSRASARRSLVV